MTINLTEIKKDVNFTTGVVTSTTRPCYTTRQTEFPPFERHLSIDNWHFMYILIVCCASQHLTIVHLILAMFVAYGERVNLAIVRAWDLVL